MSMVQHAVQTIETLGFVLRDRVCSWCVQNPVTPALPVCLHCADALLCDPHWVKVNPPPGLGYETKSHRALGLCRFSVALKRVVYRHKFSSRPHGGDVRAWASRFQMTDLAVLGLYQALRQGTLTERPTLVFPIPPRDGSRRVGVPFWVAHVGRLLAVGCPDAAIMVVPSGLAWRSEDEAGNKPRQASQHTQRNRRARWLNVENRLELSSEGLAACQASPQAQVWVMDDVTTTGATLMAARAAVASGYYRLFPEHPLPSIIPMALMSIPSAE